MQSPESLNNEKTKSPIFLVSKNLDKTSPLLSLFNGKTNLSLKSKVLKEAFTQQKFTRFNNVLK